MRTRHWTMLVAATLAFALSGVSEAGIERNLVGAKDTIECGGEAVELNGASSDLTLLGDCPHVEVNGSNQTVRIEQARHVEISGVGNTVIWERAANGRRPSIETSGIGNTARQGRVTGPAGAGASATTAATPHQEAYRPDAARGERGSGIAILENGRTRAITCAGNDVTVDGNFNTLTLSGECGQLRVNGNGNAVRVEVVAIVSTLGNRNKVVWGRGAGGAAPKLTDLGNGNDISQASE